MRRLGIVLLVLAITAAAGFGFIQTGFFQKAVWVFQGASLSLPGGSPDGRAFQGGGSEGQRPRDGERRSGPRDGGGPGGQGFKGGAPGGGQPTGGLSLAKAGWFAAIMVFFAMLTVLLDRGLRRTAARRRR
jgi:hypothetical protein